MSTQKLPYPAFRCLCVNPRVSKNNNKSRSHLGEAGFSLTLLQNLRIERRHLKNLILAPTWKLDTRFTPYLMIFKLIAERFLNNSIPNPSLLRHII
jgi:hypothetical protein